MAARSSPDPPEPHTHTQQRRDDMSHTVGPITITPDTAGARIDIAAGISDADRETVHRHLTDPGGLAGLLAALAAPTTPERGDELTDTLNGLATAKLLAERYTPRLALIARDRDAWSWRRIGAAIGTSHSTAERQVTAIRRQWASAGLWVDAAGVHDGTTAASRHLDEADRITVAQGLAHARESKGRVWETPVTFTVPPLVAGSPITVTVHHRDDAGPGHTSQITLY
uniref:PNPL.16 n=2 Tax=Nocardiopsis sp. 25L-1-1c TaxID=1009683 RepID=R4HCV8_9ACTN|nr:pNPL.16 [Nocardiopsis sp. 25L-1-1c]